MMILKDSWFILMKNNRSELNFDASAHFAAQINFTGIQDLPLTRRIH